MPKNPLRSAAASGSKTSPLRSGAACAPHSSPLRSAAEGGPPQYPELATGPRKHGSGLMSKLKREAKRIASQTNNNLNPLKKARDASDRQVKQALEDNTRQHMVAKDSLLREVEGIRQALRTQRDEIQLEADKVKDEQKSRCIRQIENLNTLSDAIDACINPGAGNIAFKKILAAHARGDTDLIEAFMFCNPLGIAILFDAKQAVEFLSNEFAEHIDLDAKTLFGISARDCLNFNPQHNLGNLPTPVAPKGSSALLPAEYNDDDLAANIPVQTKKLTVAKSLTDYTPAQTLNYSLQETLICRYVCWDEAERAQQMIPTNIPVATQDLIKILNKMPDVDISALLDELKDVHYTSDGQYYKIISHPKAQDIYSAVLACLKNISIDPDIHAHNARSLRKLIELYVHDNENLFPPEFYKLPAQSQFLLAICCKYRVNINIHTCEAVHGLSDNQEIPTINLAQDNGCFALEQVDLTELSTSAMELLELYDESAQGRATWIIPREYTLETTPQTMQQCLLIPVESLEVAEIENNVKFEKVYRLSHIVGDETHQSIVYATRINEAEVFLLAADTDITHNDYLLSAALALRKHQNIDCLDCSSADNEFILKFRDALEQEKFVADKIFINGQTLGDAAITAVREQNWELLKQLAISDPKLMFAYESVSGLDVLGVAQEVAADEHVVDSLARFRYLHVNGVKENPTVSYAIALELYKDGWMLQSEIANYKLRAQYYELIMLPADKGGYPITLTPGVSLEQAAQDLMQTLASYTPEQVDELQTKIDPYVNLSLKYIWQDKVLNWREHGLEEYKSQAKIEFDKCYAAIENEIKKDLDAKIQDIDQKIIDVERQYAARLQDVNQAYDQHYHETVDALIADYKKQKRKITQQVAITLAAIPVVIWAAPQIAVALNISKDGLGFALLRGGLMYTTTSVATGQFDPEDLAKSLVAAGLGYGMAQGISSVFENLSQTQMEFINAATYSFATSAINNDFKNALTYAALSGTIQVSSAAIAEFVVPKSGLTIPETAMIEAQRNFILGASASVLTTVSDKIVFNKELDFTFAVVAGLNAILINMASQAAAQKPVPKYSPIQTQVPGISTHDALFGEPASDSISQKYNVPTANLAADAGLSQSSSFRSKLSFWQEREKANAAVDKPKPKLTQAKKSESVVTDTRPVTQKNNNASFWERALDVMVPAAHADELPASKSAQFSNYDMRTRLEQDLRYADEFFAPLVNQQSEDASRKSVKDFMGRTEAYAREHTEPTILDALSYAAGRTVGGVQSLAKDAEMLVDPFGIQEVMRTGNITSHLQRGQHISDGIAAAYQTVRRDGFLPIYNSYTQHYLDQMTAARDQAQRGNFFAAGYTSGEVQMDVAKDALGLAGLGYGAAGLGRFAGRQAMNQGRLLYQMGTLGVEQGRAAFGLGAPFLGRGYSAPMNRALVSDVNRTAPSGLLPPQAARPDTVGQPLLYRFKPLDHNGNLLKTGLRIYQEGREVITMNPNDILPSQATFRIADAQKYSIVMKEKGWGNFTPIDVVKMEDGRLFTFDHRRLIAAKDAGIEVKVVIHEANELLPNGFAEKCQLMKSKYEIASTWKDAIEARISNQKKSAQELLRDGKWELELR